MIEPFFIGCLRLLIPQAACLPCAALTAWVGLNDQTLLTNANTVLLQRTGGVSIFGLKLADAVGASVIITSSSNEKLARASRLVKKKDDGSVGFSNDFLTINYAQEPQWEEIALAHTRGKGGVDIILENGGTATLIASMKTVRKKGTISQIGYLGRQVTADLIPGFLPLLIDKAIRLRYVALLSPFIKRQLLSNLRILILSPTRTEASILDPAQISKTSCISSKITRCLLTISSTGNSSSKKPVRRSNTLPQGAISERSLYK